MGSEQFAGTEPRDAAALIELYYQKGWTDGLPVVPPSEDSVGAMLRAAGLKGGREAGRRDPLPARGAQARGHFRRRGRWGGGQFFRLPDRLGRPQLDAQRDHRRRGALKA